MNESVKPPQPAERQEPAKLAPISGRDREFLPAALEILETPPSPLPVAMMLTICAFVAAGLIWSFVGHLDVHAVAQGKIETTGRAKIIQPLDSGKISLIAAEVGRRVKAGDIVLELESTEAAADAKAGTDALNALHAEMARRNYFLAQVRGALASGALNFDQLPAIKWDEALPQNFRNREADVLKADLKQLATSLDNLDKQKSQKLATVERLKNSIASEIKLMDTLTERVDTRQSAIQLNVGTKINLFDAKEVLQKSQTALVSDQGQLAETDAALVELDSQKLKLTAQFLADYESKLAEAARKADDVAQTLNKAVNRLSRLKLTAPIDGTVQQMSVTTVGQVVTTGQQLMIITPNDGPLQVEVLVANADIGFVKLGQEAAVKVDAFPFTRFGTLHGKIIRIATDAVDEQDAKRAMSNATSTANAGSAPPQSAQGQLQNFVFPVTLSLEESAMKVDNAVIPLTPGMTVSAEIKTDSRRVIDYLLSPIARVSSEAMKER